MVRKAPVNNETYEQFLSSFKVCGLCANSGILRMSGLTTGAGYAVAPVEGCCICPNGRAIRHVRDSERAAKSKASLEPKKA